MVKQDQIKRSSCPVSCALDILGDKWTLLVIRDIMFMRKQYFGDFLTSPEKIASNILSDRLRKLEDSNIVSRQRDPDKGLRGQEFAEHRLPHRDRLGEQQFDAAGLALFWLAVGSLARLPASHGATQKATRVGRTQEHVVMHEAAEDQSIRLGSL